MKQRICVIDSWCPSGEHVPLRGLPSNRNWNHEYATHITPYNTLLWLAKCLRNGSHCIMPCRQACPQPVSGGIVYIKYCICKIRHLVLCAMTTTDGLNILLIFLCMSTETDRLPTGMPLAQPVASFDFPTLAKGRFQSSGRSPYFRSQSRVSFIIRLKCVRGLSLSAIFVWLGRHGPLFCHHNLAAHRWTVRGDRSRHLIS